MKRSYGDSSDRPELKNTVQYPVTQFESRQNMIQDRQVILGSKDTHRNGKFDVYSMYNLHESLFMFNDYRKKLSNGTFGSDAHIQDYVKQFNLKGIEYLLQPSIIEKIQNDIFLRPLAALSMELIKKFYFYSGVLLSHDRYCFTLQYAGIANTFNYWGNVIQGQHLFLLLKEKKIGGEWVYFWEPIKSDEKFVNSSYITKSGVITEGLLIYVGQAITTISLNYTDNLTSNKILGNTNANTVEIFNLIKDNQNLELKIKTERYNF